MSEKVKEYGEVLTFFVLEALAFTSFTLGNSILLYGLFGILTFAMILLFNSHHLKELDWTYYLIFLIPFIIFAVLSGFSSFSLNPGNGMNIFTNLLVAISLLVFISFGFLSKTIKGFKITTALMTIYGGIAILVIISLGYAMVKYVPFYTMIYEGQYIYYEGTRFPIWDNIPMLMGFRFLDVSIQYFQLFGILLFTSVIGLKYISPKKETKKFIIFTIYAVVGFLAILFTINKLNIITDVLAIAFILFLLFIPKKGKILKPILYTGLAIVGVVGVIMLLNSQTSWGFTQGLRNGIASNKFLNRIFNTNRIVSPINELLDAMFQSKNLVGIKSGFSILSPSNSLFFDNIATTGFFGALSFIVFTVFMAINLVKYYTKSSDDELSKNLVTGFIMVFFLYSLIALDPQPYSHYTNVIPVSQNAMFLITLFLIGYTVQQRKNFHSKVAQLELVEPEVIDANVIEEIDDEVKEIPHEEVKEITQEEKQINTVEIMEEIKDEEVDI